MKIHEKNDDIKDQLLPQQNSSQKLTLSNIHIHHSFNCNQQQQIQHQTSRDVNLQQDMQIQSLIVQNQNHKNLNIFFALPSLLKAITSLIFLSSYQNDETQQNDTIINSNGTGTNKNCADFPFRTYLIFMLLYDSIYIAQLAISYFCNLVPESFIYQSNIDYPVCYKLLRSICQFFYYMLFIYGNFAILLKGGVWACQGGQMLRNLFLSYIIMQFISIFSFLLLISLLCFCLPLFMFLPSVLQRLARTQTPIYKEQLDQIISKQTFKYAQIKSKITHLEQLNNINKVSQIPVQDVCSICRNCYTDEQDVLQLKCSEKHYFHQTCIIKWFNINANCPICRKNI